MAVSNRWLRRAHRYLDDREPVRERVWLALVEAEMLYHVERDMERMCHLAREAKDMARVLRAVNKDPEAPIFQISDLGIVGDTMKLLPQLMELKKRTG